MNKAVEIVKKHAKDFASDIHIFGSFKIDETMSQVLYRIKGIPELILGEWDGDEFKEFFINKELMSKLKKIDIWGDNK